MSILNKNILFLLGLSLSMMGWLSFAKPAPYTKRIIASVIAPEDTIIRGKRYATKRKSEYKPADRYGDPYSNRSSKSPLLLGNPANITREVEADSAHENYTIQEKVGDVDYRPAATMTFEEYQQFKNKEMMQNYWRTKAAGPLGERQDSKKDALKTLKIPIKGLEGPFGSNFVDIKPNGVVTLDFGGRWQRVNNPTIPVRSQRNGGFEFDQQISMNVIGKIGEKLKITANWDTKATFEFQNNIKLEYTGFQEDIIQKIEAGYVSMPINSALISGAQNLFGIKTKLQFGRLSVTSVLSSQRGKVDQVSLPGGSQARNFEIKASNYEENRHFFLGQFFRNNYEKSLQDLPVITSGVNITRVNVFLTNRINNTTTNKNILALIDLGEAKPYRDTLSNIMRPTGNAPADNNANRIPSEFQLFTDPNIRAAASASQILNTRASSLLGQCETCFSSGVDYTIITSARQLLPSEFTFNSQLGYISLNTPLTAQDFVAVSYEYTYTDPTTGQNKTYKVGELAGDKTQDSSREMVILKMLKPIGTKPQLPTWDLMMKNIYQLGATQISRENFQMRIIYKDDSTGMDTPFLQIPGAGGRRSLLSIFNMDRLNPNNDPPADGNFDFIEGITIDSKYGRLIFPTLEPFGTDLERALPSKELRDKYVFYNLYKQQMADVARDAQKNKFYLKGKYQSSSTSDIMLPGINIAPGSVTVMAGTNVLVEGTDYTIDYNLGRVKIINDGVMASGQEITIKYEKQDLFNFRRKTFLGSRFDYKVNNDINIGATILHQTESPQITRTNIGDEPSSNTIYGVDLNFKKDSRLITKIIDKIPIVQTKVPSSITFGGEFAHLIPGHPKVIDKGEGGTSFIDDFEGAETPYDLTRSPSRWRVGAMPRINNTKLNPSDLATLRSQYNSDKLDNGFQRGKLAWYNIDYLFYGGGIKTVGVKTPDYQNKFVKAINTVDIFPAYQRQAGQLPETTLDLAYFPAERGPYNYNTDLDANGKLKSPKLSWGAMTRDLKNDIDFDNANIQYIEFWMMNPFSKTDQPGERIPVWNEEKDATVDPNLRNKKPDNVKSSGKLYFNLGDISEDVLKDKEQSFENGLPVAGRARNDVKRTTWANVPTTQYINNAFESSQGARASQDIGWDGASDLGESELYADFINNVNSKVSNVAARDAIIADPSADNFDYYLGAVQDNQASSILMRYKNFNGLENNSPESTNNNFTPSNSNIPDNEDLNQDNTLTFDDNYYEYAIDIDPAKFVVGQNYIVGSSKEGSSEYFQFRIPIRSPTDTIGSITDYKSLRFLRMYMNGFEEPVILRFARLQLVANQWRVFSPKSNFVNPVQTIGSNAPGENHGITSVSTVNVEENSGTPPSASTSPYVIPPGYSRDLDITSQVNRQLNEQSLRVCVEDMEGKFYGSVFKSVNLNMLNYKKIRMFLHAESPDSKEYLKDDDLIAFLRIGTDYTENYYEIEVPLKFTRELTNNPSDIWKSLNEINVDLHEMTEMKARRNGKGLFSVTNSYSEKNGEGRTINIKGSPDLSAVQVLMIGILNPGGNEHTACIWANELRLTEFVEEGGWATTGRINLKLADLANITATGRYTGIGFGSLDQKVSQRSTVATGAWGIQGNMGLEKFLPASLGLRLPLFASYNKQIIMPKYNPLDPDVYLTSSLRDIDSLPLRENYRKLVIDQQTIKSINLTNIQKVKTKPDAKSHFYDIENVTLSVGYNETKRSNSTIKNYLNRVYNAGLGYAFNNPAKPIEPFKNVKWMKSPYLKLIKDFNFSLLPTSITFRADLNRRLTITEFWEGNPIEGLSQDPLREKAFTFIRNYGLVWNLTKSITLNYSAVTNAIIDEPDGDPNSEGYNKELWKNLKRLGRMKNFTQSIGATYKVPFDKLPLTDWLSSDLSYNGTYNWTAGSLGQRNEFGNLLLQNSRDMAVNGRVSLDKIYNKVKFLKEVNNPTPKPKATPSSPGAKKDTTKAEPKPEYKGLKAALRVIMSAKSVNFSYKVTESTKIAGYKGNANFLGMQRGEDEYYYGYMLPYALGWQDPNVRYKMWDDNLISKSRRLNEQFLYTRVENFTASTQLEPFREFIIKLNVARNKTSNYNELFHVSPNDSNAYQQDAPNKTGMYNISIIAIGSTFMGGNKFDPTSSYAYDRFVQSRGFFREGLSNKNNNTDTSNYSLNSQDVLIPAFIAAYTGKNPNKAKLSPFPSIPLPNWNITFSGLSRIPAVKKIFNSVNLTHSYLSNFSVSNYTSSLTYSSSLNKINIYSDPGDVLAPDSLRNGNFVPIYNMDVVSIKETFSPLIGVNLKTKGKASYNIQYLRDRSMVLSMSNAQLQETSSSGLTIGFAWTKANFKVPFKWQGRAIPPLKNELQFKADLTVRDNKTVQRVIGGISTITAGTTTIQFRPTINYMISQRVNVTFYFDRQVTIPRISSSFRRGVTSFGIQLKFTLS